MVTRADIVREALEWEGTRFKWGQSTKGHGCDCKGLIYGVARELGLPEAQLDDARFHSYHNASSKLLLAGLERTMVRVDRARPGDVLALPVGFHNPQPRHLAILVSEREILHCYGRNIDRVIKVPLGKSRPVHSVWTWRSLMGGEVGR